MVHFPNFTSTEMAAEYVRETFRLHLRETSAQRPRPLPEDHLILCLSFDLGVATRYAQGSNIPETVQAIFYAMVVNEVAERAITCRISAKYLMWALQQLYWGPFEFCPQVESRYPQFPSLPAFIDGRAVAGVPRRNQCRDPKKIPYAVPLFEPGTPSWSSCKYSSTPNVLSPEVEVSYPWEITIANYMTNFQVRRMAKTKSTPRIRSPDELLVEGTQGNPCSAPSSSKSGAKVASTSTSSISGETSSSSSSHSSSRHPSSEGASISSSSHKGHSAPSKSVLKRKCHLRVGLVPEIVADGPEFLGAPTRSDPQDEADATVNELPAKCIAVYSAALNYGLRFPLQPVIEEILNKYELAPAQKAPKETGDFGWYYFNNRLGFMTAIEKKSEVKHWKYDFLFVRRESGWENVPDWNEGKPVRNPFGEPMAEERKMACYFQFYIRKEDKPRPIPKFIAQVIESVKGPKRRKRKSGDRKPLNWLPKLKFFGDDFFLAAAGLLILKNFSKEQARARLTVFETGAPLRCKWQPTPGAVGKATPRQPTSQEGAERYAPRHSRSRSTKDRTCGLQEHTASSKTVGTASQARGGSPPSAQWPSTNFIKADPTAKFSLDQDLVKSYDLATSGSSDSLKITEEEVTIVEAVAQGEFQEDSYFEAYLHYVDERQWAEDKGRDPEEVEFIPPSGEGEVAGDEAANPLDADAEASEEEGHEDSGEPDV
ncbi:hypothetical protein Cgig2_026745 [Carnegiea gigantea]|uniref:Uncharacterized protein n=1 Tax=Carnegiea gigantea TaxID=171969 RepID=A0A9Q1JUF9_9CARY|nr:hypothetical protein Cgig2_026745 [Carnegiea gigantea]